MKFSFINYGGTDQVRLESAEDLDAIEVLDEAFWMATSAPAEQLKSDPRVIAFLDKDGNKRVVSTDLRRTLSWLKDRLANLNGVAACSDCLKLADLKTEGQGQSLREAALVVLACIEAENKEEISLENVRTHLSSSVIKPNNGDGIIIPRFQEDEELRIFIEDIITTVGGVDDQSGEKGLDAACLDKFIAAAEGLLAWQQRTEESSEGFGSLFPLGDRTAEAYGLFCELREPINQFFQLSQMSYLNDALELSAPFTESGQDSVLEKGKIDECLSRAPLAKPSPEMVLDLSGKINPYYHERIRSLKELVITPLIGDPEVETTRVSYEDWRLISSTFSQHEEWLKSKVGGEVEPLGLEKLKGYLSSDLPQQVRVLIEKDLAIADELGRVDELENLILLQRWFMEICRNFVNFHNLYDPERRALFEMGRFVIGGRVFNLNIRVDDANKHGALAKESGILLLYSEVTGSKPEDTFNMVTPVTNFFKGELGPERRGVLFDDKDQQLDVRVISVVDNPVSLLNEIKRPFKRIGKLVGDSFSKLGGSAEKQISSTITDPITKAETNVMDSVKKLDAQTPVKAAPQPPPAQNQSSGVREWIFSGSVAFAALGSSFAYISKTLSGLNLRTVLQVLGIVGFVILICMIVILIPVILIADYRLKKRNLASLLHASGWAVNAPMLMTSKLAKVFAPRPIHPDSFYRIGRDISSSLVKRAQAIQNVAVDKVSSISADAAKEPIKKVENEDQNPTPSN